MEFQLSNIRKKYVVLTSEIDPRSYEATKAVVKKAQEKLLRLFDLRDVEGWFPSFFPRVIMDSELNQDFGKLVKAKQLT